MDWVGSTPAGGYNAKERDPRMIRDIQDILHERRRMSLLELAIHFDVEPQTLQPIMDTLLEKGRVRKVLAEHRRGCAGCLSQCDAGELARTIYEAA